MKVTSDSLWPYGLYSPWNSPSQNTGADSLSLLQGIFPTQGSNPGLLHCGHILYQLSHKGSLFEVKVSGKENHWDRDKTNRLHSDMRQMPFNLEFFQKSSSSKWTDECITICPMVLFKKKKNNKHNSRWQNLRFKLGGKPQCFTLSWNFLIS